MLVVFDLDGTLVDSSRDIADTANALLESYGAAPLDQRSVVSMVGEGAAMLVSRLIAARAIDPDPVEALSRFLALYDERLLVHTRPYAGIPEALDDIGAWAQLAVLTNKPCRPRHESWRASGCARDSVGSWAGTRRWGASRILPACTRSCAKRRPMHGRP